MWRRVEGTYIPPLVMGFSKSIASGLVSLSLFVVGCQDHDHDHMVEDAEGYSEAFEELSIGKADGAGCSGVTTPDQSGFGNQIALTFDDGPHPNNTPRVLDILKDEGIQATFFINGNKVNAATRPILQRIIDEGHILANHSQSHQKLSSQRLSTVRNEVRATHDVIRDYATPEFFRFPYGASTCDTASIVRDEFGQTVTGWNVDTGDWCFAPDDGYCPPNRFQHVPNGFRSDMVGWTMHQVNQKGGGIVLMHDVHDFTAETLPEMISRMRGDGYTFTNLDDEETFPLLNGVTLPWVGDTCEGDDDCGIGANYDGVCDLPEYASEATCTLECEGLCPDRGNDTTFCVSLDGGDTGTCVLQAKVTNDNCDDFDHLVMETRERYVGESGVAATLSRVCVPR